MAWITKAIKVISSIASIAKSLDSDSDSVDLSKVFAKLEEVLAEIDKSKYEIIRELHDLEKRELIGSLNGLIIRLRSYDPVETDANRLLNVIDDAADLIGRIEALLDSANPRNDRFLGALTLLITTNYLRAFAMVERERRTDSANPEIEDAISTVDIVVERINQAILGVGDVDQRLGNCVISERRARNGTSASHGYTFDGNFVRAGYQHLPIPEAGDPGEPPTSARAVAKKACENKKDEILTFKASLEAEIETLEEFKVTLKSML